MNTPARRVALLLAAGLALPIAGRAAAYDTVLAEQSRLAFTYRQMNVAVDGRFRKFTVQLDFDPARAERARVSLDVDLASIDTGFAEGDNEVAGTQWFDSKAFPSAHFDSASVKALGNDRFEVTGQLSIKGRTRAVSATTTVSIRGSEATFDGSFVLKRADFAIGEGPWADFSILANEIQVRFHILARSAK